MKEYLSRRGLGFQDLNIREDEAALRELVYEWKSNATPTIVIDGEVIVGYDRDRMEALLAG